jgi:hypothetical protein
MTRVTQKDGPKEGLLGIREFAASQALIARMGRAVAPSTVTRWGQDGKIVLIGHGRAAKIDVAASLARLDHLGVGRIRDDVAQRHATEARQGAQTASGMPVRQPGQQTLPDRNSAAINPVTGEDLGNVETTGAGKAKYKAAVLHYENSLIKLGLQLARGQRYDKTLVKDEAAGLGNALRAAVERLVDQTAPRLAVLPNHLDRGLLLRREVRHIKRLINLEHAASLRRLKRSAKRK